MVDVETTFAEASEAFLEAHHARLRAAELFGLIERAFERSDNEFVPEIPCSFHHAISWAAADIKEGMDGSEDNPMSLVFMLEKFEDLKSLVNAGLQRARETDSQGGDDDAAAA